MKIAVDARELVGHATGVGRYLAELIAEWATAAPALRHEWRLYAPQPLTLPPPFAAGVSVLLGVGNTSWEQWQLPRALAKDRPDVLFAPGYTAPLGARCPVVQTIHDVSYFAHPEWFRFREGLRRRLLTRMSAARASVILTDTEFSRGEIIRHLKISPARVRVIPLGVRAHTSRPPVRSKTREPLVLFVGSIFARRHVDVLLQAFVRHVAPRIADSRLEIVGENRSYPPINLDRLVTLQSLEVQRRISIRSYVDSGTLADLYERASVFVFPSEYEGFGFTPLEALAAGVVPIVLDTPVAMEVYGAAARYVANSNGLEERLGQMIGHLLANEAARSDLLRHAPAILARYQWPRTAAATLAVLEEAGRA